MAYTQPQHDALEAAIAQGALEVRYGDKKVTYRSLDDMFRILKLMNIDLGLISANGGKKFVSFSKGIEPGCSDDVKWIR
jgi:hypothetical protein